MKSRHIFVLVSLPWCNCVVISFIRKFLKATEFLLVHQPEIDSLDKFEWTPLMWAVKKDYFEIIKLLVEYKADINHKDDEGTPIIQYAVENESVDIVKFLIEKGLGIISTQN